MIKKIVMKNLTCPNCISQIETAIQSLDDIKSASFNRATQTMLLDLKHEMDDPTLIQTLQSIADQYEDHVVVSKNGNPPTSNHKSFFRLYGTLSIGVVIFLIAFTFDFFSIQEPLVPYLMWGGYFLVAAKLIRKTIISLKQKALFNENFLMFVATFSAMIIDKPYEAIIVVVFYSIGEYLQNRAVNKSRNEISALVNLHVDYAIKINQDGTLKIIDPSRVEIHDHLRINKGDSVPVDGVILKGKTTLDTSFLSGESKPNNVHQGDYILSGSINTGNVIEIQAKKHYENSAVSKIISLIENATEKKAKTELFITKFAKFYTPVVIFFAILIAVVPSILYPANMDDYILRAATFLVISCPCALVLSIPLSYYAGIGRSAKEGILFKGASVLDMIHHVSFIGFDKTGTLTNGTFEVTEVSSQEALEIAGMLEAHSNHPIAKSILANAQNPTLPLKTIKEHEGLGITAYQDEDYYIVGNQKLMELNHINIPAIKSAGTIVYVAKNTEYIGFIRINDTLKPHASNMVKTLSKNKKLLMLTGDNQYAAEWVSNRLHKINYSHSLLPEDKIKLFNQEKRGTYSMYVGDGINDAPLIKAADIGVAVSSGSDIALDVADIIITSDQIHLLEDAFSIAKKTRRIVIQNIALSLGVKFTFLALATFGLTTMWMAIFADVGITLIAVMNALRLIYGGKEAYGSKRLKAYA